MQISMPTKGNIGPCHEMTGKFGISSENGLVLVGSWPKSYGEYAHAFELMLADPGVRTKHWPIKRADGYNTGPDEVLDLGVDRVSAITLDLPRFARASDARPGDLYIDRKGACLIGANMELDRHFMFDLETREVRQDDVGRGFICKKWRLTAFRAQEVVFEIDIEST